MARQSDIDAFHAEVDLLAAAIADVHAERLQCKRGCSGCCVDDITVWEIEAQRIRDRHQALLQQEPHPEGACAFLDDEGACRIYSDRPYVCRTQGLPIRWIDDEARVEHRDICELNEEGTPIVELPAEQCWTIGPAETKLYALTPKKERVRLRDLFQASSKP